MNTFEIIEALAKINEKGIFSFVAVTQKEALKKSRLTKIETPNHLKTITVVRACTVSLGHDYQAIVNLRLRKEGQDANFVAGETYCYPYTKNNLIFKHHKKDSFYLRVYPNIANSFKTILRYYDSNGLEIHNFKEIEKEFFPLSGGNENQGLDNSVVVNNYKIENVKYLKRGSFMINEIDLDIASLISGCA